MTKLAKFLLGLLILQPTVHAEVYYTNPVAETLTEAVLIINNPQLGITSELEKMGAQLGETQFTETVGPRGDTYEAQPSELAALINSLDSFSEKYLNAWYAQVAPRDDGLVYLDMYKPIIRMQIRAMTLVDTESNTPIGTALSMTNYSVKILDRSIDVWSDSVFFFNNAGELIFHVRHSGYPNKPRYEWPLTKIELGY